MYHGWIHLLTPSTRLNRDLIFNDKKLQQNINCKLQKVNYKIRFFNHYNNKKKIAPPQFLADDDVVVFPTPFEAKFPPLSDDAVLFPYGSPVDYTVGVSRETESDEQEQLVAELTRHLTRSSLQPDTE